MGAVAIILAAEKLLSNKAIEGLIMDSPFRNLKNFMTGLIQNMIKIPDFMKKFIFDKINDST